MPLNNARLNRTITFLLVALMVTIFASWKVSQHNLSSAKLQLDQLAEKHADHVIDAIKLYRYGLNGARGVLVTHGETGITREIFREYALSRDLETEFPGARGFGFIRRVPVAALNDYIAAARADGWPEFNIRELSPNDNERFVIQYIVSPEKVRFAQDAPGESLASPRAFRCGFARPSLSRAPTTHLDIQTKRK